MIGNFGDTINFDPGTVFSPLIPINGYRGPTPDIFMSKFDHSGNLVWVETLGEDGNDRGTSIVLDDIGHLYIGGLLSDDSTVVDTFFNTSTILKNEIFISKLDTSGNSIWTRRMETGGGMTNAIALDATVNLYAVGNFYNYLSVGDTAAADTILSNGGDDIFILKLDTTGHYRKGMQMGGITTDECSGMAIDATGAVYTTGYFNASADLDPGPIDSVFESAGNTDAFILKMACKDTSSSFVKITTDSCKNYTLNGHTYTSAGEYTQIIPNLAGCDSTITLSLSISNNLAASITRNGNVLSTGSNYASYQWLLDNNTISGATGSNYVITGDGSYKVIVSINTAEGAICTDTSDILTVSGYTAIENMASIRSTLKIYPNPASDIVTIDVPVMADMILTSLEGKKIMECKNITTFSVKELTDGIYFLQVCTKTGELIKVEKIMVSGE